MPDCGCTDPGCGPLTEAGPRGPQGVPGPAPTFLIGDVTSVPSGNPASVTLTEAPAGTWTIDFVLVAGPTGPAGATGPAGPSGTGIELLTTKGDLLSFSTVPAVLGVGADGSILTANSLATFGIEWVATAPAGFVVASNVGFTPAGTIISTDVQAAIVEVDAQTSKLSAKGDLLTFAAVPATLPVGTNGQVITANSAAANGLEWANSQPGVLSILNKATGDSPYTLLNTTDLLQVDASAGAVTVILGLIVGYTAGKLHTVKDIGATGAGTNNITIQASGGQLIDGTATYVVNIDSKAVTFYTDGTAWYTQSTNIFS